ncbi:MAG: LysM peptidoglycan-binding domain-containing protein, partial [Anaerolineales bacterium]
MNRSGATPAPSRRYRIAAALLALLAAGCTGRGAPGVQTLGVDPWVARAPIRFQAPSGPDAPSPPASLDPLPLPPSPTPDPPRPTPEVRTEPFTYVVQPGDSLGLIASRFEVSPQHILDANGLANPNVLSVGQFLTIPAPALEPLGSTLKIVPDSELVYGPASIGFDLISFTKEGAGYLDGYVQEVEGRDLSGPALVQLAAQRYAVNPRLLLALLEYQSGWVTSTQVSAISRIYPMGFVSAGWEGLWSQLSWAADTLNEGYYRWKAGWNGPYLLADRTAVIPGSGINAATAAVQHFFSQLYGTAAWSQAVDSTGFPVRYASMFGSPFARAVEPLVPSDLEQPEFQLPIEDEAIWSLTSGPHSAWGSGSAWA